MEYVQKIFNKVLFDGQAWLYATILKVQAEAKGETVTEERFLTWENEYKNETRNLINEVVNEKTDDLN